MAVQDIQAGFGMLHGIPGAITLTPSGGSDLWSAGAKSNISSLNLTHNFTLDETPSSDGTIIEQATASKEFRDWRCSFMPKADTRANAEAVVDAFLALTPLKVIAVAVATVSAYNGSFNFMGGMTIDSTRDGKTVIEFNLRQYKDASGNFSALAAVTG
jgi:hypothetical protein